MKLRLMFLAALCSCGALAVDSARIQPPTTGYFHDAQGFVRAMRGIPGAISVGEPINLESELLVSAIHPERAYLLAALRSDGRVVVLTGLDSQVSQTNVDVAEPNPDRILIGPSGRSALLVYASRNALQWVTGLPDKPSAGKLNDVPGLSPPVSVLAVSDSGTEALLSSGTGDSAALVALHADGTYAVILSQARTVSATFLHNSTEAVVATAGTSQSLYRIHDVSGAAEIELIPLDMPVEVPAAAIAVSGDNRRAFLVNRLGTVVEVPLEGGGDRVLQCECSPDRLVRLAGNAVFQLTDAAGAVVWLLDADGPSARFYIVPPGAKPIPPTEEGVGR